MAYVAVDRDNTEHINTFEPMRRDSFWDSMEMIEMPKGSIKKLIGRELTWEDEAVDLNGTYCRCRGNTREDAVCFICGEKATKIKGLNE